VRSTNPGSSGSRLTRTSYGTDDSDVPRTACPWKAYALSRPQGTLIVIGGHEEKDPDKPREILERVAQAAGKGPLVISAVASRLKESDFNDYKRIFKSLGVQEVTFLGVRARKDAYAASAVDKIKGASAVFFTGGDQLRITSQLGASPAFACLQERFQEGLTIAGTSAGAACMPDTMIFSGTSDQSGTITTLGMAPGLGLLKGVVVDSHFAERGRFGRLLGAIAENPKNVGLGIDEDTALVLSADQKFEVIGSAAVYVMDGREISYTSLSDERPEGVISIFGVRLHVLTSGDMFDLASAQPCSPEQARDMGTGQA
jgi:cyanophycinase